MHPTSVSSHTVGVLIAAGVVVGALTSPFVAVWTVLLGIPAAALAWTIGDRRGVGSAYLVAAAVFGLVVGASLYFVLGVVVAVSQGFLLPGHG